MPGESESARLEELLAEFVELREAGRAPSLEEFVGTAAGGDRELARELRAALAALDRTEAQLPRPEGDLPERVGPYRVRGELGRGGMGRVLRVVHEADPEEELALKVLHVALEGDARAAERFRREAAALERVRHPGVVRVRDTGVEGATPWLAMELVEGRSLAAHLAEARGAGASLPEVLPAALGEDSPARCAARVVARLARAVAAAHREGVLHRDVNPKNVLVRPDGEPVLIEFGLVRAEDAATLTGTGDMLGTPRYMAPEQARGERVDGRTDVFGLGSVLYELLALQPPRPAGDTLAVLRAAGSLPLVPLRRVQPDVPRDLAVIVQRATSWSPARRTADAEDLATDLEAWLDGAPIRARAPGLPERAQDLWLVRRRGLVGAAVVVLGLALAGTFLRGDPLDHASRVQASAALAAHGLLHDDVEELERSGSELAELLPDEDVGEFLRSLARGVVPATSTDPPVRSMITAERARRAGRIDEAREELDVLVNIAPSPVSAALRCLAARDSGDPEAIADAYAFMTRALGQDPLVHATLAAAYLELERFDDVEKAARSALALDPGDAATWRRLAEARRRNGDSAGAAEAEARADQAEAAGS